MGGRAARPVRTLVDAMTALPDIIAGLFILAFMVLTVGLPESGFAAALALAVTMLPIVTRASETVLRIVPGTLREASYALGGSQWRTVLMVVLPDGQVRPGHRGGAGDGPGHRRDGAGAARRRVRPGHQREPVQGLADQPPALHLQRDPEPDLADHDRAFGGGFALFVLVLVLFTIARRLGGGAPGELTRRQRRQIARQAAAHGRTAR